MICEFYAFYSACPLDQVLLRSDSQKVHLRVNAAVGLVTRVQTVAWGIFPDSGLQYACGSQTNGNLLL